MNSETHLSRNLAALLLIAMATLIGLSLYFKAPIEISFAVVAAGGVALYVAARVPEILMVAAMFAPQWKNYWPLNRLGGVADVTFVAITCLALGIIWRLLDPSVSQRWDLRRLFFRQSRTLLAYLFFALVLILSYFHTTAPDYGWSKLSRFLVIGTLFLLAPCFVILTESDFRRFALLLVACAMITSLLLVTHVENRADPNADITRIGAGWLLGMATLTVLFYPLFEEKWQQMTLFAVSIPSLAVGLIASAARGAVVSLIFVIVLGAILRARQGRLRLGPAILAAGLLAVSGLAAYYALRGADLDKYNAKVGELFKLSTGSLDTSGSGGKRLTFYRATLGAIPDNLLLGRGIGSWAKFYYGNDLRNYPHNFVLELTFEEGLLGLTAYALFLLSLMISAVWMLRESRLEFLAVPLTVLYCVSVSMFSGDLDDNRLIWLWAGMTLALCRLVNVRTLARVRLPMPNVAVVTRDDTPAPRRRLSHTHSPRLPRALPQRGGT